jgi:protein phosphatase
VLVQVDIDVGVATHTGQVRNANEDDYLLIIPDAGELFARMGRLFVVADGMGGVSGGSEASRAAVRYLASTLMDSSEADPEQRMREGFLEACRGVYNLSKESARLREMGTTLTAVNLLADKVVIGHVGDSRCQILRRGKLSPLTVDHAVQEPRSLLTRCIGAGQEAEEIDVSSQSVQVGDVLVLMTDGVWNVVDETEIAAALRAKTAQEAADRIVRAANLAGGPDNSTILVLRILSGAGNGELRDIELPYEEQVEAASLGGAAMSLIPPRWPWLLLGAGALLALLGASRLLYGVDWIMRLRDLWAG